jgi:LysR family transcriptional activator of nhaA
MDWLNYHHLHYFWLVAREGTLTAAAEKLRLSPSTVSTQIRQLEAQIGEPLFHRQGRGLVLTDLGRTTLAYADRIFSVGRELRELLARGGGAAGPRQLRVGVADILPKLVAWRFLEPALHMAEAVHLVCRADAPEALVAALAVHEIDVVLTDAPVGLARGVRAYTHPFGGSAVGLYATPALAADLRRAFPDTLAGSPMLLPSEGTTLRRGLDRWLAARSLRPLVVAEFEDSALLKTFGQASVGSFAMPILIEDELIARFGVERVGLLDGLEERFFATTMHREPSHPAVRRLLEAAGQRLHDPVDDG